MKVKVLRKFRDKVTGEIRRPGDVLTMNKKRFAEVQKVGEIKNIGPILEEIKDENEEEEAENKE